MKRKVKLSWMVKTYDVNRDVIEDYDVLTGHETYIRQMIKKADEDKEAFSSALNSCMMYHFWSKCEWEIIVTIRDGRVLLIPWCGSREPKAVAVDVTDEKDLDWPAFAKAHISTQRYSDEAKIDVYDQLLWRWGEFLDYIWESFYGPEKSEH